MTTLLDKRSLIVRIAEDHQLSKGAELRVAVVLLDHFNLGTGRCDPSVETIAKRAATTRRGVFRALGNLVALGYFVSERRGWHRSSTYMPMFRRSEVTVASPLDDAGEVTAASPLAASEVNRHLRRKLGAWVFDPAQTFPRPARRRSWRWLVIVVMLVLAAALGAVALGVTPQRSGVRFDLEIDGRALAVSAGLNIVGYSLTLIEAGEPSMFDGRDVHENVLVPGLRLNEAIALLRAEPFHGAGGHGRIFLIVKGHSIARSASTVT
jgi:hypothetical protein